MNTHAEQTHENKTTAVSHEIVQQKQNSERSNYLTDNRPVSIAQRKLQENIKAGTKLKPVQKKENNAGLPHNLQSGIENLSGLAMDDIKVHYNSDKPAQLQAHAYAQGTEIHLAPGQEKHLPHEAWHVVQQKQGRVQPTLQLKGRVNINNDEGLEQEADVMGSKALQMQPAFAPPLANGEKLKSDTVQRTIALGAGAPAGFRELTNLFLDVAKESGGEILEMINALETDPKMHLYFYASPLPKGEEGLEGRTIPAIKVGEDWKMNPALTDDEWNTLPDTAELRIELHIHYAGEGLDKDHSKHFYTLLHEFAVHAQPFYSVFKKIRSGHGPKSKNAAAELGHHAHFGQHHDEMALGQNAFYEDMYSKSLDIIRKLELQKKNKNISTAGIIDQRNLDKYTQKLSLFIVQKKLTDADLLESTTLFQQAKTKENYIKFHQSLQRTAKAIEPIKDDLNTFTLMFELWPQLVAVFPKEQQFMGTGEMYLTLLPKIKSLNQGVESYYNEISTTLAKTTANLSVAS